MARHRQAAPPSIDDTGAVIEIIDDHADDGEGGCGFDEVLGEPAEAAPDIVPPAEPSQQPPVSMSRAQSEETVMTDSAQRQRQQELAGKPRPAGAAVEAEAQQQQTKTQNGPQVVDLTAESDDDIDAPTAPAQHQHGVPPSKKVAQGKAWACGACTLLNEADQARCSACDRWRYSTAPLGP